jgi:RNA polymerase sigma-70 factor (ECF subfamily)
MYARGMYRERHGVAPSSPPNPDDDRTDAQLVEAANAGDTDAFAALYQRYRNWVYALALRLTGRPDFAADVTQDVFLYVLRCFPGFELRSQFKTFLYPAVRHRGITLAQKARQNAPTGDPPDTPTEHASPYDQSEQHRALAAAVDDLPPGQREVLLLRYADDLPLQQIAAALEIPLGTVKSRLHLALQTLRDDSRAKNFVD